MPANVLLIYRPIKTVFGSVLACLLISACATPSSPHEHSIDLQIEPDQSLLLESDPYFTSAEPVSSWWKQLNDPLLNQLIEDGLQQNHDIRIGYEHLQQARAVQKETEFDRVPTVEIAGEANRQRLSKQETGQSSGDRTFSTYQIGFDASWELDLFGRVSERLSVAEANVKVAEAQQHGLFVTIAAEIARNYMELRGAQLRLEIARQNVQTQSETYELIQSMVNNGAGDEFDLARAEAQRSLTESTVPQLEGQIVRYMNRLSVLTGHVPDSLTDMLSDPQPIPSIPKSVATGDVMQLLKRRPDIQQAEYALSGSIASYQLNRADLYPKVDLIGTLGFLATTLADLGTAGTTTYLLGARMNWAAFNLGRVQARIDAADADARVSVAQLEQTILVALDETNTSMQQFTHEAQTHSSLYRAAEASAKAEEIASIRFNAGSASFLDVLDSQSSLLEAQDSLAQSEIRLIQDVIAVYKALGGGWETK